VVAEQNVKVRVAVFGSGLGSVARALIEYAQQSSCAYRVVGVLSNRAEAGILGMAGTFGIPAVVLTPRDYATPEDYTAAILEVLERWQVECIALAGYLLKVPSDVVARYQGRIVNTHPSLLPKFGGKGMYGIHVHRAVCQAGERCTGATIHLVTDEYDAGPIREQVRLAVYPTDDPESVMARVQAAERWLYPRALERLCRAIRSQS
jgi:phosphoribosylglycinamide formyltransferase-1